MDVWVVVHIRIQLQIAIKLNELWWEGKSEDYARSCKTLMAADMFVEAVEVAAAVGVVMVAIAAVAVVVFVMVTDARV